jgi:hypothetical protein
MPAPRLPPRIEQHNSLNNLDSQFRREFGRDAFPDPSAPVQGFVNNRPCCRVVCELANSCPATQIIGYPLGNGCYEVCVPGPFADANSPTPPQMSLPPHQRTAGTGEGHHSWWEIVMCIASGHSASVPLACAWAPAQWSSCPCRLRRSGRRRPEWHAQSSGPFAWWLCTSRGSLVAKKRFTW